MMGTRGAHDAPRNPSGVPQECMQNSARCTSTDSELVAASASCNAKTIDHSDAPAPDRLDPVMATLCRTQPLVSSHSSTSQAAGDEQTTGATDMSFDEALNRRDMAEVDRRVESRQTTGAATRFDFDNPDEGCHFEEGGEEDPPVISAEELSETTGGVTANPRQSDVERAVEDRIKRVIEAKAEHGLQKRFKLEAKVDPASTDYTNNALVTKADLKRLAQGS